MGEIVLVGVIGSSIIGVALLEDRLLSFGRFVEADLLGFLLRSGLTVSGIWAAASLIMQAIRRFIL
ncbi:hypothetical protein [Metabacillus sp. FJAT-52054]|uniref:Uncharacterized protein n=1 Tax=Metabacillus sediminis TaxID=3117746 RepID=A0ABZ2NP42_9BACI